MEILLLAIIDRQDFESVDDDFIDAMWIWATSSRALALAS